MKMTYKDLYSYQVFSMHFITTSVQKALNSVDVFFFSMMTVLKQIFNMYAAKIAPIPVLSIPDFTVIL